MRIRTFLLVACMVVVPMLAMFSHRFPAGTRAAVGEFFRDLVGAIPPVARPQVAPAPAAEAPAIQSTVSAAAVPSRPAVDPPAVVTPTPTAREAVAPVQPESLDRLRDLGAVAVACLPLEGNRGHVATCRLPVDAAGQLERVFQATGPDPVSAADQLLRDVTAWKAGSAAAGRRVIRF